MDTERERERESGREREGKNQDDLERVHERNLTLKILS